LAAENYSPCGNNGLMISSVIFTQYQIMTDRQT